MIQKIKIFTDGGARGNPGPAACGVIVKDEADKVIGRFSKYLGERTNNQAEYEGVILALTEAQQFGPSRLGQAEAGKIEIDFYLDSLLVVNQLKGSYKVKDAELQKLFVKIWNLSQKFKKITYTHVPRAMNALADRLVNDELDKN
ncbi:MAG: ribonuclease HI family protein [Candidatus Komeilibacteria bacterium]|nr:ribonuclease HI family protein [Candidatus Komeilibacteria bacterium]